MARLQVSYEVHYRDEFGRFRAALDEAATKTVRETADDLERLARKHAPSGPGRSDYGRRPKLKPSIEVQELSSRSARVGSNAGHAKPQEEGAGAHVIEQTVVSRAGNEYERHINHPGNAGRHYLADAVREIMPYYWRHLKENYPG